MNVSISGGTRVEIKGVSHITSIPDLVHNEAFRQKSLLEIRRDLCYKIPDLQHWKISHTILSKDSICALPKEVQEVLNKDYTLVAVNLPGFRNILSFFTQPGRMFSDEISDRLKVIACIEKPNMIHSEDLYNENQHINFEFIRKSLNSKPEDAQIVFWAAKDDIITALETIEERCKMAFIGIPNETRKSLEKGITMFERVLPGADRMYPDTDSAPITISEESIYSARSNLPMDVDQRIKQLKNWDIPLDAYSYLLRNNLIPLMERICLDFQANPKFVATLLAHRLKSLQGKLKPDSPFDFEKIYQLFAFLKEQNIEQEIILDLLPVIYKHPNMEMMSALESINFLKRNPNSILSKIPLLREKFSSVKTSKHNEALTQYIMKELRKIAIGNIALHKLASIIRRGGLEL